MTIKLIKQNKQVKVIKEFQTENKYPTSFVSIAYMIIDPRLSLIQIPLTNLLWSPRIQAQDGY